MAKSFTFKISRNHQHAIVIDVELILSPSFLDNSKINLKTRALIDTGANSSCISSRIVNACKLNISKYATMISMNGNRSVPVFKIGMNLPNSIMFEEISALEFPGGSDFDVIIGMDILSHCDFAFTGKDNDLYFSVQIPHSENIIDFTNE